MTICYMGESGLFFCQKTLTRPGWEGRQYLRAMTYFPSNAWQNILDMVPSVANHTNAHRRKVSEYESRNPAVAAFKADWEDFETTMRIRICCTFTCGHEILGLMIDHKARGWTLGERRAWLDSRTMTLAGLAETRRDDVGFWPTLTEDGNDITRDSVPF